MHPKICSFAHATNRQRIESVKILGRGVFTLMGKLICFLGTGGFYSERYTSETTLLMRATQTAGMIASW